MARKLLPKPQKEPASKLPAAHVRRQIQNRAFPDVWALDMGMMVDGHPFDTRGREYVSQVMRDNSQRIVIPKAAQTGFTVSFLIRTLHWAKYRKWHHLYMLPLKEGTKTFVQQRIDPLIQSNPELASHFQRTDNRNHKQSVDGIAIYIRGTNIWNELREIPTDAQVWDERDRMVEDNLPEAEARLDGSKIKHITELSTPTVPGHGIDADDGWQASDQHRWEVPCPFCSHFQVLTFKENVKVGDTARECVLECQHCHKKLTDDHRASMNASGHWTAMNLNGEKRGYHISQLNSPSQPLVNFMKNYFQGQTDIKFLRAFHNNNLGEPFVAYGDQITAEMLDKLRRDVTLGGIPNGPVYIGVDVGTLLHLFATTLDRYGNRILWDARIFSEFSQLDEYFSRLNSFMAVIDAHPEKRAARDLSVKYQGRVWVGFELDRPEQPETAVFHKGAHGEVSKVSIDRTMAFDGVIRDCMNGNLILPKDAREIGELMPRLQHNGFYDQHIQMVRVTEEDLKGRDVARWKKNKKADHWHHANMFNKIATMQKPSLSVPSEIADAFQGSLIRAA